MYNYYLSLLGEIPYFLEKYLTVPCLLRLKDVGYFCGMDYASEDIYDFGEYISRYDHSLTVALLTYKYTKRKKDTIAALFHDIATPCFAHVIDYMNNDYEDQESTEEYTEKIIRDDKYLLACLKEDRIKVSDIINFKRYSIVDLKRPKLCADRIDGIVLTGAYWAKNVQKSDIKMIVDDLKVYENEDGEAELGFKTLEVGRRVLDINESIDRLCHSNEDNYMMELLASITKRAIDKKIINYDDLYYLTEKELFALFDKNKALDKLLYEFRNIKFKDIKEKDIPNLKIRVINPLVQNKRIL